MKLAGFEQKDLAGRAAVQCPAAMELLNALFGEADQVAFMKMRVVGMAFEMRTDRLDAGFGILVQIDPVIGPHGGSMSGVVRRRRSIAHSVQDVWNIRAASGCSDGYRSSTGGHELPAVIDLGLGLQRAA